jgi:hypothetical protein
MRGDHSGDIYYELYTDIDNGYFRVISTSEMECTDISTFSPLTIQLDDDRGIDDYVTPLEPVDPDAETVRRLWRMDVTPWELAEKGMYPFTDIWTNYVPTEDDIFRFIENASARKNPMAVSLWTIFCAEFFLSAGFAEMVNSNFPLAVFLETVSRDSLYFDSSTDEWSYLENLKTSYLEYRRDPLADMRDDDPHLLDMMTLFEVKVSRTGINPDAAAEYEARLERMLGSRDPQLWRYYAYAYYGGNEIVSCNWKKSETALLMLYSLSKDPRFKREICFEAANSLGYIYYSNRLGRPDYKKAYRFFSFAAENGMIEATYKLFDMFRNGHGVKKDLRRAWKIISNLHSVIGEDEIKYPDVALRMGYCFRDGIGIEVDLESAREYFIRAKNSLEYRLNHAPQYGDNAVMMNVNRALASLDRNDKSSKGKSC